ncbi:hypothetical protein ACFP6B_02055 [Rothia nasimurium]|uniref:hypothetical protein n=1 Tax=Rothia nasimurium TaxID=85336 RepID=UPI00360D7DFE
MNISPIDYQLLENAFLQKINEYVDSGVTFNNLDFDKALKDIIEKELPKGNRSAVQKINNEWRIAESYMEDLMFKYQ